MIDNEKEGNDKVISLIEFRKLWKDDIKYIVFVRIKENFKEGFKDNLRRDVVGEFKGKDVIRDGFKFGSVIKKINISVMGWKVVLNEQKSLKIFQDKKLFVKDNEREWVSLLEFVFSKEEEKFLVFLEVVLFFFVFFQFVLDYWVVCDKCE